MKEKERNRILYFFGVAIWSLCIPQLDGYSAVHGWMFFGSGCIAYAFVIGVVQYIERCWHGNS